MFKKKIALLVLAAILVLVSCKAKTDDTDSRIPLDNGRVPVENEGSSNGQSSSSTQSNDSSSIVITPSSSISSSSTPTSSSKPSTDQKPKYDIIKTYNVNKSSKDKLSHEINVDRAAKGLGYVGVTIKNTSAATKLTVSFITDQDQRYSMNKSVTIDVDFKSNTEKTYVVDLSDCYGFYSTIKKIKIESSTVFDGEFKLTKVELYKGGSLTPPFSISNKKILYTRDQINSKVPGNVSWFPDGMIGITSNNNGTFNFFSSSPLDSMKPTAIFKGTVDNPIQEYVAEGIGFHNIKKGYGPDEYNYISLGQIYSFGNNECLSLVHLEQHFDSSAKFDENTLERSHENNAHYVASLGLAYSDDGGMTWYYCGKIATHAVSALHPYYGMGKYLVNDKPYSRDIGNGPFIVKDGYIYAYIIDFDERVFISLSVMRAPLEDVIAAARAKSTADKPTLFKKYYNGKWNENGINGKSTSVIDDECPANFTTVIYSDYLKKYILARCSSVLFSSNDGDIVLNISDDPTNFKGKNYYIDASPSIQQYPTLVGDSSNPGFVTGKKVYLYYIDAEVNDTFLWHKANLAQRVITFD